jgi:hypothetical protein
MTGYLAAFTCSVLMAGMFMLPVGPAQAAGCLSGAAVGGVAGHVAGHHGVLGAAAGCAVGHHEAAKNQKQQAAQPTNGSANNQTRH